MQTFSLTRFARTLPSRALAAFGPFERLALKRALQRCRMRRYPAVVGDPYGDRAAGDVICETCKQPYNRHPLDWRETGYEGRPYLNILCDGRRVKL
jgi:hypothetical protein